MLAVLAVVQRFATRRARTSGRPSFEALFREHHARVRGFFHRRGCPADEVRDLAQETFLRAFDAYEGFRGDAKASTWLLTIAGNLWLNRQRDAAALKRDAEEISLDGENRPDPPSSERVDEAALEREKRRLLRAAIDELPKKMRRCVLLRVYQDRSHREIAELLGVSEATAKSQVSRARRALREILAERFPELDETDER